VDYQRLWRALAPGYFAPKVSKIWIDEYLAELRAAPSDIVVVDPGNGFNYVFDLAGSLTDCPAPRSPRVLGVWGPSQPGTSLREDARIKGHPRPRRGQDDRGHLIAFASGGGYDINLLPMDAALNRGWSEGGARFRAMERRAAASPGTLFFIRPIYADDSDRPSRFEVGVQDGAELIVDVFVNEDTRPSAMSLSVLRQAVALPIDRDLVVGCLDIAARRDALFEKGWRSGPGSLTTEERNTIAGVTGHVAESVTELLLDALRWQVLWHFVGPGRHGVDLLFLAPDDKVVAVEVKGTLVPGRIPRLSSRELGQMSAVWVDKVDNPGMAELGLSSEDVYGAVVAINFADLTWRAGLTSDFVVLRPALDVAHLASLAWLDEA
jgi:hypothetical protein